MNDLNLLTQEKSIIGSLLFDNSIYGAISKNLSPKFFQHSTNRGLYTVISSLIDKNQPANVVSVLTSIEERKMTSIVGVLTTDDMMDYIDSRVSMSDCRGFALQISQNYTKREIISNLANVSQDMTFDELKAFIVNSSISLKDGSHTESVNSPQDLINSFKEYLQPNESPYSLLGIPALDENVVKSFTKTNLAVIAAPSGVGKTNMLISSAVANAMKGLKPMIISLEMSEAENMSRLIAHILTKHKKNPINMSAFQEMGMSFFDNKQYSDTLDWVVNNIFIQAPSSINANNVMSIMEELYYQSNFDILYFDYLGLINTHVKGRTESSILAELSNNFKSLARKLNIPVFLLSQINNEGSKLGNKSLEAWHISGSGGIFQASDLVCFLQKIPTESDLQSRSIGQQYSNHLNLKELTNPSILKPDKVAITIRKQRNSIKDHSFQALHRAGAAYFQYMVSSEKDNIYEDTVTMNNDTESLSSNGYNEESLKALRPSHEDDISDLPF